VPYAIGISGSPRRGGNSETLLQAALDGARDAGAEVELVRLNELTYKGCQNCQACVTAGHCTQDDDLAPVLDKLRKADVWLLSSPIYFCALSGQLKTFFDRCWCFIHKPNKLEGKRSGAIIITYEAGPSDYYHEVATRLVAYFNWFGDFDPVEVMAEPRLGPPDAASKRPELLAKATELGKRLVAALGP
jgi:multimeric flavodoxin WrbA